MTDLGFSPQMTEALKQFGTPGRISGEAHGMYHALTEQGEISCRLPGRLLDQLLPKDRPVTGDFVAVDQEGLIQRIHERQNLMTRGDEFSATLTEGLVANADYIFVTLSLNQDFNLRKLRWFLIAAGSSGAATVLILTKADLNSPALNESYLEKARRITDAPIFLTRMDDPASVKPVLDLLKGGQTGALLGASGAGKSTLTNLILGEDRLKTSGIRISDDQGRHTTTHREIVVIEGIGCLIDTPGMRRIKLQDEGSAVEDLFQDLLAIMASCRYPSCSHTTESGCAVREALNDGTITESDLTDYHSMLKEARYFEAKARTRERTVRKREKSKQKPRQKNWSSDAD